MKQILVEADVRDQEKFVSILQSSLSEFQILTDNSNCDPNCVEYVIFWRRFPTYLNDLTNLKALLVCGSGIDHFDIPINLGSMIPLVRLVDPFLKLNVARYVENQLVYLDQLTEQQFNDRSKPRIGILGRGQIGKFLMEFLTERSYEVRTWSKHLKNQNDNMNFYGFEDLERFLNGLGVLICALPLTIETKQILNSQLFSKLGHNCYLINIGRSGHLDEQALISALAAGKIFGASLDLIEPFAIIDCLTEAKRKELRLRVTQHVAGYISAETQAPEAIKQIMKLENGDSPDAVVNFTLNY